MLSVIGKTKEKAPLLLRGTAKIARPRSLYGRPPHGVSGARGFHFTYYHVSWQNMQGGTRLCLETDVLAAASAAVASGF